MLAMNLEKRGRSGLLNCIESPALRSRRHCGASWRFRLKASAHSHVFLLSLQPPHSSEARSPPPTSRLTLHAALEHSPNRCTLLESEHWLSKARAPRRDTNRLSEAGRKPFHPLVILVLAVSDYQSSYTEERDLPCVCTPGGRQATVTRPHAFPGLVVCSKHSVYFCWMSEWLNESLHCSSGLSGNCGGLCPPHTPHSVLVVTAIQATLEKQFWLSFYLHGSHVQICYMGICVMLGFGTQMILWPG